MKKWPVIITILAASLFLSACEKPLAPQDSDQTNQAIFEATQSTLGFSFDLAMPKNTSKVAIPYAAKMVVDNLTTLHKDSDLVKLAYVSGSAPNTFSIDVRIKGHEHIRYNCNANETEQGKIMAVICKQGA